MEIYVLLKQTFDTEEKIVIQQGAISEDGVKFVINPYDEYAVEQAIQFRDEHGGKITVLAVGPERMAEALRTALAMGADEAVLINDDRITSDEYAVAHVIHLYLSDKSYDLILGGSFSVDNGAGQVTIRIAKLLGIPHVSTVTKLELAGNQVVAYRDSEGDLEVSELSLPALFTAQQGLNEPRYPSLPGIMKAKKKPFKELNLDDLGISELVSRTVRTELFLPDARKAGQILKGEPGDQVKELVSLLRNEAKVI
ncbi:electron transfer flavoprotein subunit beta/FixA family protein [Paenibacillus albiflavus]|uniref:Electron transfer flavoprotein subunit beta n=1 Tax=Paenibacillus albiflavus TaxID=2545760 RepID=A0A4R4E1B9_9BACL|nr:electron transfer flavoprotein subunit beta/FixA family protein [Paenibacillus albiflavus]TCZ73206.1 electron transfer flavoprotein subunit beta/FixA family protein [Paenibacillus albiflavus]